MLKKEPNNLYAANGMAVMIGERGHLSIAQEYMIQVRESASDYPQVLYMSIYMYVELDLEKVDLYIYIYI